MRGDRLRLFEVDVLLCCMRGGEIRNAKVRMMVRMSQSAAYKSDRVFELAVAKGALALNMPADCPYSAERHSLHRGGRKYSIVYFISEPIVEEDEIDEFEGFIDPDTGLDANGNLP